MRKDDYWLKRITIYGNSLTHLYKYTIPLENKATNGVRLIPRKVKSSVDQSSAFIIWLTSDWPNESIKNNWFVLLGHKLFITNTWTEIFKFSRTNTVK